MTIETTAPAAAIPEDGRNSRTAIEQANDLTVVEIAAAVRDRGAHYAACSRYVLLGRFGFIAENCWPYFSSPLGKVLLDPALSWIFRGLASGFL